MVTPGGELLGYARPSVKLDLIQKHLGTVSYQMVPNNLVDQNDWGRIYGRLQEENLNSLRYVSQLGLMKRKASENLNVL